MARGSCRQSPTKVGKNLKLLFRPESKEEGVRVLELRTGKEAE